MDDGLSEIFWVFVMVAAFGFPNKVEIWHVSSEPTRFIIHNILNLFGLLLILYLRMDNSFDCAYNLCVDKK